MKRRSITTNESWTSRGLRNLTHHWQILVMALPAMAFVVVFSYVPMYGPVGFP